MSEKTSPNIQMADKLYNASTARDVKAKMILTKKGNLRKKFKEQGYSYDKKTNTISKEGDLLRFQYTLGDVKFDDNFVYNLTLSPENNLLLKELVKQKEISGDYRLLIYRGKKLIYDKDADITPTWWNQNESDFVGNESGTSIWNDTAKDGEKITIVFAKNKKISKKHISQNYLDSHILQHCVFTPILNHYKAKLNKSPNNSEAKACINKIEDKVYKTGKVREGYINKYKNGIPQEDLHDVFTDLKVNMKIKTPFSDEPYLHILTDPKHKCFDYLNTRLDHVEYNENGMTAHYKYKNLRKCDDFEFIDTQAEMDELFEKVKEEYPLYGKGAFGVNKILLPDKAYKLRLDKSNTMYEWMKECKMNHMGIDRLKYENKDLISFLDSSTHFNGTVDFRNTKPYQVALEKGEYLDDIRHIDVKKAYSAFKECSYYCGFLGHISDFRECTTFEANGIYLINNLKIFGKLKRLNDVMKIYKNNNVYTKAELDFLKDCGATFDVIKGARGRRYDFSFNEAMKTEKIEIEKLNNRKIPMYSFWTGLSAKVTTHENLYQEIQDKERPNLAVGHDIYRNDEAQEWKLSFPREYDYTKIHLTSQIIAYTRLIILEQLMNMDIDKIIRVCVDGIYYEKHDCEINNVFQDKSDKMTFKNSASEEYVSNLVDTIPTPEKILKLKPRWSARRKMGKERKYYDVELFDGEGGVGKTHHNINDKGLRDICYVPHSWKLASNQKQVNTLTHSSLLYGKNAKENCSKYATYLIDECSMLSKGQQEDLIDYLGGRIIFMGDPDCQLPFIGPDESMLEHLSKRFGGDDKIPKKYFQPFDKHSPLIQNTVTLTKNYRIKCDVLRAVTLRLRDMIKKKTKFDNPIYTYFPEIKTIDRQELKSLYNYKEDIILVRSHKTNDEYNKMFEGQEKYKVLQNGFGHYNGSIVFEKPRGVKSETRHGYTVHSVQGETYEGKIFIDVSGMDSQAKMLYTAISRGEYAEKIYFVIP